VAFADLTHTHKVVDANYMPLAVGFVAAYAKVNLGDEIEIRIFKYPNLLSRYLLKHSPKIVCFSNYMWNERLVLGFLKQIKLRNPEVITVVGGPNYPSDYDQQQKYLKERDQIDFYIDGEGEMAFVDLFQALRNSNFDADKIKNEEKNISNCHYMSASKFVKCQSVPRITDLDQNLPSPYLLGLLDEFFDEKLMPMIQTSRGCPYSCTYCHDGIKYMNKTLRFSTDRVQSELAYISERVKVPGLTLADLNWGMFPEDVKTAHILARMRQEKGYPKLIGSATAKNQKKNIVEMSKILGDMISIGASIQSTDPTVLRNIKRNNISIDTITDMAKESAKHGSASFSEIILCLPGDTKLKHIQSVCHMLDAGIEDVRSYQFILLPGTEGASEEARVEYEYESRFRVLPRCFGVYSVIGKDVVVPEIHEVCVGNKTMPHGEYLECRDFDLSISIFNNGKIFEEIFSFAMYLGISRSELVKRIHNQAVNSGGRIGVIYKEFREDEERNFWPNREALESFSTERENVEGYLSGSYGDNQIYKYRTRAIFEELKTTCKIPFQAIKDALKQREICDPILHTYLKELEEILCARKNSVTDLDEEIKINCSFDFVEISRNGYEVDPRAYYVPKGVCLTLKHGKQQRKMISEFFDQYGWNMTGVSYFIHRNPAQMLYRQIAGA